MLTQPRSPRPPGGACGPRHHAAATRASGAGPRSLYSNCSSCAMPIFNNQSLRITNVFSRRAYTSQSRPPFYSLYRTQFTQQ
jgi:hypothetical protein